MRFVDGRLVFSPSDLNVFFESPFASWMDHLVALDRTAATPDARAPEMELVAKMGDAHERAYLATLAGVWECPRHGDRFEATRAALRERRAILYQAALRKDGFEGHADFLERTEDGGYEVVDTKLARTMKPYFLIQLCAYADMLEVRPRKVHIVNGAKEKVSFRTDDYFFYYLALKERFLAMHAAFDRDARPVPDARADHGRWQSHADAILEAADHPARVAGITANQVRRLAEAGVTTMKELAAFAGSVPRIEARVLSRLREQARLQIDSAGLPRPLYEIVVPEQEQLGLALLPPASPEDVFFDMEGYPLVEGGLEYLFGAMTPSREFVDFWAHDAAEERRAFEAFLDFAHARYRADPHMHVYHYASYELTALRRLAGRYGTREAELDELLRAEVFVDLYRVVRQGVRVGEPGYSLKNVEHLYRGARTGDVATAAGSVVEYARWLDTRDPAILEAIRAYNRDDCESTLELASWLHARQAEAGIAYAPPPPAPGTNDATGPLREDEIASAQYLAMIPPDRPEDPDHPDRWRIHELLAHLVTFHRREEKPFWWSIFDKRNATDEELVDDPDCLGDLVRTKAPPRDVARSVLLEYAFDPNQETKVAEGSKCKVVATLANVTVEELDLERGRVVVRSAKANGPLPRRLSLVVFDHVSAAKIAESIRCTAEIYAKKVWLPGNLRTLLHRESPGLLGHTRGEPLLRQGEDLMDGTVRVIRAMRATTLAIQGPPGAGKTTTAARAILALVRDGKRVGITSNSHKAIDKLMEEVLALEPVRAVKIADEETVQGASHVDQMAKVDFMRTELVGGTAWKFCDAAARGWFSHLFVDEAGQVSLANVVGMAPSAENLVLLGDPMQLAQPTRGTHPGESGLSALEYAMVEQTTIRPEQGIFLARTWRLHPSLCAFVSGAFYEDRLAPEACTAKRFVRGVAPGLHFVPVEHEDNVQSSEEEADAIEWLASELVGKELVLEDGTSRAVTADDILVVAPYNLQVRLLAKRLPGFRVGTVDKFQGQQAAIAIVSMCASSGERSPRGLEFLLSPNRMNVAVSRAQCVAFVVGSPAMATARVRSVRQMRLVNLHCRVVQDRGYDS